MIFTFSVLIFMLKQYVEKFINCKALIISKIPPPYKIV